MAEGYDKHECTICLGVFNKLKILPCYHTFCEDCLTGQIQARAQDNKLRCPVCRQIADVPAGGARGFQTNFYIAEVDRLFCSKHMKVELKFYCRDCSEAVCGECVVFKHKGHNVDYISTVDEEHKQQLKPLTEQLDEKVAELKQFSENLEHTISHINTTADTACKNVDSQTEKTCQQLRKQAKEIKNNIIQIQDDSKNTVHKMMENINRLITKIETGVNCSRDVLTGKTTSKSAVDILSKIHSLIESGRKASVDLPEVRYPVFKPVDIGTKRLRKLLGELDTVNEVSFSVSFNVAEMRIREDFYGLHWLWNIFSDSIELERYFVIHDLPFYVRVKRDTSDLRVDLILKSAFNRVYSRTADMSLLNTTDDSQSVVVKIDAVECTYYGSNMYRMYIDWKKLTDPNNGFLQDNRFTIQTKITVTKID